MPLPETGWIEFLGVALLAVLLFTVATGIFYSLISLYWSRIDRVIHRPALAVQLGMLTVLAAHSAVVWLYALTYWSMAEWLELGNLAGMHESGELLGYVYFSVTTYSSLGLAMCFRWARCVC